MLAAEKFSVRVCRACKAARPDDFDLIAKTVAKDEFLLTDADIADLPFLIKEVKPSDGAFGRRMHLYLRLHVRNLFDSFYFAHA